MRRGSTFTSTADDLLYRTRAEAAVAGKQTREATLARIARSHELVFGPHMPFPGVGHVVASGAGYAWAPALP